MFRIFHHHSELDLGRETYGFAVEFTESGCERGGERARERWYWGGEKTRARGGRGCREGQRERGAERYHDEGTQVPVLSKIPAYPEGRLRLGAPISFPVLRPGRRQERCARDPAGGGDHGYDHDRGPWFTRVSQPVSQCSVYDRRQDRAAHTPLAFLRLLWLFYEVSVQGQANEKKRRKTQAALSIGRTVWRFGVHN